MGSRLAGRVVVVTGASMGIGRSTAIAAANEGAKVAVCDIADTEGKRVVEEIRRSGGTANFYHVDVSKERNVAEVLSDIASSLGPVYGLVNNAGVIGTNKPTHELEESDWDSLFAVNVKGGFFCTKHAVKQMIGQGRGAIVNLSSAFGIISAPDLPPYHASKGAVRLMTKTDALIYARKGIRVNSVHPGFIDTPMGRSYAKSQGDEQAVLEEVRRSHPMGRLGRPEEIAAGIVFLLSDDSSFMTGSELVIDGGVTIQ